jgi:hypothetical protein
MATPKQGYWIDGEKVPGTTTVIGRFKESGGLLQWAFKQGQSGASSLYEQRDKAADIGTAAHAMIEAKLNGDDPMETLHKLLPKDSDDAAKAINAFDMYLKWEKQTGIKMLSKYQEIQFVSPQYKFGGTPDAIGEIDGEIVLLDWKTSNGVYQDYIIQLAAYRHLINDGLRMDTGKPLDLKVSKGAHLLRFAKEHPDFGHHYFGDLDQAWRQFVLFREAYDIDKDLKKRAA